MSEVHLPVSVCRLADLGALFLSITGVPASDACCTYASNRESMQAQHSHVGRSEFGSEAAGGHLPKASSLTECHIQDTVLLAVST